MECLKETSQKLSSSPTCKTKNDTSILDTLGISALNYKKEPFLLSLSKGADRLHWDVSKCSCSIQCPKLFPISAVARPC